MTAFQQYSEYYDLFYQDKDYEAESAYVDSIIRTNVKQPAAILDLGCGSGGHVLELARKGYDTVGVDSSESLVKRAEQKVGVENQPIKIPLYKCDDVRRLHLDRKFDAVISLFHVLSYQISNRDVDLFFRTAREHIKDSGILLFDFWYGPAVLTQQPEVRLKAVATEAANITRRAEPVMHPNENCVDVHYAFQVEPVDGTRSVTFNEVHRMRYFFKPEIDAVLARHNFELISFREWLTDREPGVDTWGVCVVAKPVVLGHE